MSLAEGVPHLSEVLEKMDREKSEELLGSSSFLFFACEEEKSISLILEYGIFF
jgi:hypothetical protein